MQQGSNLGEVIGLLIAAPFVALADYFGWIKKQPPGTQELTKACHGAGMLALLWYCCSLAGGVAEYLAGLVLSPGELLQWIPVVMGAWGLGWLLLNARPAALAIAPSQRATMIVRALIKLALGWALWSWADADDAWLPGFVFVAAVWCFATGGAKLLLMLWGRRHGQAEPLVAGDIAAKEFDWDEGRL